MNENDWEEFRIDLPQKITQEIQEIEKLNNKFQQLIDNKNLDSKQNESILEFTTEVTNSFVDTLTSIGDSFNQKSKIFYEKTIPLFLTFVNLKPFETFEASNSLQFIYQEIILKCIRNFNFDVDIFLSILYLLFSKCCYVFDNVTKFLQNQKYFERRIFYLKENQKKKSKKQKLRLKKKYKNQKDVKPSLLENALIKKSFKMNFSGQIWTNSTVYSQLEFEDLKTSLYLIENIQFFGSFAGFDLFLNEISSSKSLKLIHIEKMTEIIDRNYFNFDLGFQTHFNEIFVQSVISRLRSFKPEIYQEETQSLFNIFAFFQKKIPILSTDTKINTNSLTAKIEIFINFLLSKSGIEKKNIFFQELDKELESITTKIQDIKEAKLEENCQTFQNIAVALFQYYISTVFDGCCENQLKSNFAKYLKTLLVWLLKYGIFPNELINQIWIFLVNDYLPSKINDTKSMEIMNLFTKIVSFLTTENLSELNNLFQNLEISHPDSRLVSFIDSITRKAIRNKNLNNRNSAKSIEVYLNKISKESKDNIPEKQLISEIEQINIEGFGLLTLWKLLNTVYTGRNLGSQIKKTFQEILFLGECGIYRDYFKLVCLKNLLKRQDIPSSLDLLNEILSFVDPNKSNAKDLNKLSWVEFINAEKKYHLIDLIIEDLSTYYDFSIIEFQKMKGVSEEKFAYHEPFDANAKCLAGNFSHADEIRKRLEFLECLLEKPKITLTFLQINKIWDIIITKHITKTEIDIFFQWLEKLIKENSESGNDEQQSVFEVGKIQSKEINNLATKSTNSIQTDILKKLFTNNICGLDPAHLYPSQFEVFREYFLFHNKENSAIIPLEEDSHRYKGRETDHSTETKKKSVYMNYFIVRSKNLVGFEHLLNIISSAIDNSVGQHAIDFCVQLFLSISTQETRKDQFSFLETCMEKFREVSHKYKTESKIQPKETRQSKTKSIMQNSFLVYDPTEITELRIIRFISLFKEFVIQYDEKFSYFKFTEELLPHISRIGFESIKVQIRTENTLCFSFKTYTHIPLLSIVNLVSEIMEIPVNELVFIHNKNVLKRENIQKPLNFLKDSDTCVLSFTRVPNGHPDSISEITQNTQQMKETSVGCFVKMKKLNILSSKTKSYFTANARFPALFLLYEENFDHLVTLWNFSHLIASETFELISLLPTNFRFVEPLFNVSSTIPPPAHIPPNVLKKKADMDEYFKEKSKRKKQNDKQIENPNKTQTEELQNDTIQWDFINKNNFYKLLYQLQTMQLFFFHKEDLCKEKYHFFHFKNYNWCEALFAKGGVDHLITIFTDIVNYFHKKMEELEKKKLSEEQLENSISQQTSKVEKFRSLNNLVSLKSSGNFMSTFSIKNFSKQRYFYQLSLFRYIIQSYSVLLTILMQITNEILFLISFQPLNRKMESKKIMKTKALLQLQNPDSEEELTDSLFRATQFFSKFSSSFQIYISSRDHSIQAMIESLVDTSIYMLLLISIKDPSKLFHFASPRIQNQHSFMLVTSPRKGGRQSVKIHSEFSKWIFFSLITNKCDSIKKSVFRFIKFFSSQENSHENKKETHDEMKNSKLRRLFFDQIFEFLPYVWKYKTTIHEYFHLLLDLVKTETKRLISTHQILILNQKKNIYYQVSNQIRKFLAKKFTDPKFEIVVGLLIKLLKLLFIFETEKRKVFSDSDKSNDFYLETESLVGELVDAFLLVFHEDFPRKMCKKLFLEIMKQDQKLSFKILSSCFNKLDPFVNQIKKNYRIQDKFSFTEDANADGYVGLENIGSTCYANSVLQQLFGIQFFRETILSINTEELLKSQQQTDDEQDDAIPVLFELKKIFQGLQRKEDKSQSTFEFCQTFKNIDGNPIKAGKQEDAIEFLHNLFDKIARALKNTENYDLLQKLFEVELVNHFICNEKRHKINHIEKELSVSVEVKHKTNLIESLEHYVEGEFMKAENQFYCSKCEKKVDALKKIYFGSLPKILIIHLKRFEYNPQNGSRTKVDSEFEFPVELDMSKFTLEEKERQTKIKTKQIQIQIENHENQNQNENQKNNGNQNEKCKTIKHSPDYFHYHLVGVVVHNGNLNQGHYISYIQENQTEKLYNFNTQENLAEIYQNNTSDHERSEDDAEDIDEISVDPEYPIPKWHKFDDRKVDIFDTSELPKMAFGGKPFSAYLLFYERDSCTEEETKETFNENEKQTEIVKKIENPNSEQTNGNPEDLVLNSSQENINSLENISEFDLIGTRESGDSFSDAVVDSYSPPTDINDQFIDFCSRILDGIYNKKEGVLSDWDDEVMKLIIHSIFRVVVFVPAKMQLFDWDQKIQSIFQKSKSLFKWLISELKDPVCPISINRLINDDILSDKQKFETYNLLQTIFKGVNSMQENENFGKEFIQQNNLFFQGFIKYLVDNMKTFSISWSIFLNYLRLLIYIISVNPQIPLTLLEMKLHKKMIDFFPKITNLSNENTLIPVEKLSPNLQEEEEKKEIFLEQENFQFISTFFKLLQYLILEILQLNIDQEIEDLLRIFKDNLASFVFLSKDPKISGIIDSFFTSICSRNRNFIFFFLIVCVERISQNQNTIPNVEMILRILSIPHIDQEKYIEFAIKKIQELVVSKSLIDYQVQKIQNRIAKARISNRVLNDWLIKNFQSKSKENLD